MEPIKRQGNGRFAVGHIGGPGRKPKAVEARYTDALTSAITPGDLCEVWRTVLKAALSGDMTACKLLMSYCVGTPTDVETEKRLTEMEAVINALETSQN